MRLTLRTLLAYLDDILEPADAREIGAKIAESSYASSLVGKIRDVVRRRRIGAPEVSGPNSTPDPNIVAEYLDNTLPPESVADLERVCLESDVHLAEVAACHQILTLVRSEPVSIPAGARERAYALGAVRPTEETAGAAGNGRHVPRVAAIAAADVPRDTRPGSGEATLEDRLPEALLRRRRSWVNVLPYVAALAVLVAWGWVMWNDDSLTGTFSPASRADRDDTPAALTDPREAAGETGVLQPSPPSEPGGQEQVAVVPDVAVAAPDLTMTPPPLPEEGVPVAPAMELPEVPLQPEPAPAEEEAVVASAVPSPDATTPLEPEMVGEGTAAHQEIVDVEEVPLQPPLPLQDASASGVLLHYQPAADDWFVLRPRSAIHPQEEVAAPVPFDATFTVGEGGRVAEVLLRGGTRVQSLGTTSGGRFGFNVHQGQLVIRRKDSAPAEEPVSMQIQIREDRYDISFLEPGTIVGIEVIPLLPTGPDDTRGATRYGGGIALVQGMATVSIGEQEVTLEPAVGLLRFLPAADAPPTEPQPLDVLPDWLKLDTDAASAIVRRYAALYDDEFILDQPISQSIRPVVKDRRPPLSELATQTLALTGRYPSLVDALSAPHEEARLAAIKGLMAWLPLDPEHSEQLRAELNDRFREDVAGSLHRLLWGYSEEQARNQIDSEDLVQFLGHEEIAIRELAFFHIHRLTGRRYDYRPNDPPAQREAAIQRWRRYLEENGALISP